jgi:exodeoxyribonuclease VII large subunit
MPADHIFTVSELNEQINLILSRHFPDVAVEGEISEIRTAKQGRLLYLVLKDERAEVTVFAFADKIVGWDVLEEGMQVTVYGRPEIYAPRGRFNFHAHDILPAGEGALKIAFEKLKKKLEAEGLFAEERKRPLPEFPETIGLLTAPESRAYSDFVKVLGERMGGIKIIFYPVQVQGVEAPRQIVEALAWFSRREGQVDLLVLTRGGGSLEDLAAFNNEEVARAVFRCVVPTVSAVGHEADITLVDLVADLRASTPSNAAELVVVHRGDLTRRIDRFHERLLGELKLKIASQTRRIDQALASLDRYFQKQQLVVETMRGRIGRVGVDLNRLRSERAARINLYWQEFDRRIGFKLAVIGDKIDQRWRLLQGLNPEAVLARGYSVTRKADGELLKSASQVKGGERITTSLHRGTIDSTVTLVK